MSCARTCACPTNLIQATPLRRRSSLDFHGGREVRHTLIRVITAHLKNDAAVSWQGLNFDFTGAVFDGGDFAGAVFSGGQVSFKDAVFSGGQVDFASSMFRGSEVGFAGAEFSGGEVDFAKAREWLVPPAFPWTGTPPPSVKLPKKKDQIPGVGLPDPWPACLCEVHSYLAYRCLGRCAFVDNGA